MPHKTKIPESRRGQLSRNVRKEMHALRHGSKHVHTRAQAIRVAYEITKHAKRAKKTHEVHGKGTHHRVGK